MYNLPIHKDLECCEAVLLFLIDDEFTSPNKKMVTEKKYALPNSYMNMLGIFELNKIRSSVPMIDFTIYINKKYNLNYQLRDINGSYKIFFKNHVCEMYQSIIRQLKLDILNI